MGEIFQGFECNRRLKTDDAVSLHVYNNKIDILLLCSISNYQLSMRNDNMFKYNYVSK